MFLVIAIRALPYIALHCFACSGSLLCVCLGLVGSIFGFMGVQFTNHFFGECALCLCCSGCCAFHWQYNR